MSQSSGTLWIRGIGRIFQVQAIPRSGGAPSRLSFVNVSCHGAGRAILVAWLGWMARGPPARQPQRRHVKRVLRSQAVLESSTRGLRRVPWPMDYGCTACGCQTQSHRCSNPPPALASNGGTSPRRGKALSKTIVVQYWRLGLLGIVCLFQPRNSQGVVQTAKQLVHFSGSPMARDLARAKPSAPQTFQRVADLEAAERGMPISDGRANLAIPGPLHWDSDL